jgi:hypothetical protein
MDEIYYAHTVRLHENQINDALRQQKLSEIK